MNKPTKKPVVVSIRTNGQVDIDVPAVSGYSGFDKLKQYLENEFQAYAKSQVDGPDARKCVLEVADVSVVLLFEDPFGNSIHSVGPDLNSVVERIGRDLERRLTTK